MIENTEKRNYRKSYNLDESVWCRTGVYITTRLWGLRRRLRNRVGAWTLHGINKLIPYHLLDRTFLCRKDTPILGFVPCLCFLCFHHYLLFVLACRDESVGFILLLFEIFKIMFNCVQAWTHLEFRNKVIYCQ